MRLPPRDFLYLMERQNHHVFYGNEQSYNLNIIGYRRKSSRPNYFDDTISVYYQKDKLWYDRHFEATTVPGLPYLLNPMNPKGTAILVPGQYLGAYKIGMHKGKYKALVQIGAVNVFRDNNKDNVYDTNTLTAENGIFGINIHKASTLAKLVGTNSAGCQVIKASEDFNELMELCRLSVIYWGNKFSYTLVNI